MASTAAGLRNRRRGFSLLEVGVATFIMVIVALAGASYYYYARWAQFRNMQEQAAMNLAEIEIEKFRQAGYSGMSGYTTPSSLPHGYSFSTVSQTYYYYPVVDGITYRVSASLLYNTSTSGSDYRWETTTSGVTTKYRRVLVKVDYGAGYGTSTTLEGRIGE
ncbi:MAG: type II secretion system protein [Planctomycetes bacterium]|nr:type II secretion system protein [Planctomycetota bacterium]